MNLKQKYDKLNEYEPSKRYCFNYNYHEICKKNGWNIRRQDRFRNQIFFVYSEVFKFNYSGKKIKFLFDRDDYYMSRIIKNTNSFYEIKYLEYLKNKGIINQGSCVADVGSYLGNHALYFSKILNCKQLYCFEPTLYSYSVLIDNLEINNVISKDCFPVAVGAEKGKMLVDKSNCDNPGANQYKCDECGEVECLTIDSLKTPIDFLKIDVENMEIEALKGCDFSINKFQPIIMIEVGKNVIPEMNQWIIKNKYRRIGQEVFSKNTWLLDHK